MRVGRVGDDGVGGDKPGSGGGVKPGVHVDEAEAVVVQVAGEAAFRQDAAVAAAVLAKGQVVGFVHRLPTAVGQHAGAAQVVAIQVVQGAVGGRVARDADVVKSDDAFACPQGDVAKVA